MQQALLLCLLCGLFISTAGAEEPRFMKYESGNPYEAADQRVEAEVAAPSGASPAPVQYNYLEEQSSRPQAVMTPPSPASVAPVAMDAMPRFVAVESEKAPVTHKKQPALVTPRQSLSAGRAGGSVLPPEPVLRKVGEERTLQEADTGDKEENPEILRLNAALEAVKEEIISTNKQINDERKWVAAVSKITSSYADKMKRVSAHIVSLRAEMKKLYQKKKMIENLKLQKQLEAKLKEANTELATLQNSLKHVKAKNSELNKSHQDLKATIAGIQAQIAKLKGDDKPKKAKAVRAAIKAARAGGKKLRGAAKAAAKKLPGPAAAAKAVAKKVKAAAKAAGKKVSPLKKALQKKAAGGKKNGKFAVTVGPRGRPRFVPLPPPAGGVARFAEVGSGSELATEEQLMQEAAAAAAASTSTEEEDALYNELAAAAASEIQGEEDAASQEESAESMDEGEESVEEEGAEQEEESEESNEAEAEAEEAPMDA